MNGAVLEQKDLACSDHDACFAEANGEANSTSVGSPSNAKKYSNPHQQGDPLPHLADIAIKLTDYRTGRSLPKLTESGNSNRPEGKPSYKPPDWNGERCGKL